MSRSAVPGSTRRNGDSRKKTAPLTAAAIAMRAHRLARVARPARRRPGERDGQEDRVVVRRERRAARDAPAEQRFHAQRRSPMPRVAGQIRRRYARYASDDQERDGHVVLDVVRVQHVQRRDGEEQGAASTPANASADTRAEHAGARPRSPRPEAPSAAVPPRTPASDRGRTRAGTRRTTPRVASPPPGAPSALPMRTARRNRRTGRGSCAG